MSNWRVRNCQNDVWKFCENVVSYLSGLEGYTWEFDLMDKPRNDNVVNLVLLNLLHVTERKNRNDLVQNISINTCAQWRKSSNVFCQKFSDLKISTKDPLTFEEFLEQNFACSIKIMTTHCHWRSRKWIFLNNLSSLYEQFEFSL